MSYNICYGLGPSALAPSTFAAISAVGGYRQVVVTFSDSVMVSGPALVPANYPITLTGAGVNVLVTAIEAVGSTLVLTTDKQTPGAAYTVHLPLQGILSGSFAQFVGPFDLAFTGGTGVVSILQTRSVDAFKLEVNFNIPVLESTAIIPTNYTINNGLVVLGAVKITDFAYRLTTTRQVQTQSYTVSISGIEAA
jgi:hypothetical protein